MDPAVVGALIQAGGGLLSSALGIGASGNLNSRNRDWQSSEALKSRNWTAEQNKLARTWQRDFYDYMFNKEAQYNSPLAEMQRYRQAGINPLVMMSQAGAVQNGAVNVGAPSASSVGSGASAGTPVQFNPAENVIGFINALAGAMKSISEAKLNDSQRNKINTLLNSELENLQLNNEEKKVQVRIFSKYGETEAAQKIALLAAQTLREYSQRDLNNVTISQIRETINNLITEGEQRKLDLQLKKDQYDDLVNIVHEELNNRKKEGRLIDEKVNTEKTQQSLNQSLGFKAAAEAKEALARCETENQFREYKIRLAESEINLNESSALNLANDFRIKYERLKMDKASWLPNYQRAVEMAKQGRIKTQQDFIDLLCTPIDKFFGNANKGLQNMPLSF